MSNVKQADVVSHVALADVLECRTLPRSVAANLEKVAGSDGQVSVDALVDMVVTDHESGGDRKVLRRSVLGITIAMVCLSAVVCGLVFGSVHLTTQMQVQDGVLHARDSADTVMHSGTTVAAFSPSDLKTLDNLQMSSMQTLLFSEEDGTMHMYRVSSVSSRPDGAFEVLTMSGEEFVVSTEGSIQSFDKYAHIAPRELAHEAGYDAFMTGTVFACLVAHASDIAETSSSEEEDGQLCLV